MKHCNVSYHFNFHFHFHSIATRNSHITRIIELTLKLYIEAISIRNESKKQQYTRREL